MMKKWSELSLEELNKTKSKLKGALIAFIILGVLISLALFFLKAKLVLFIPAMVLPITWLPIYISLKSVNDEIRLRNATNINQ
jgi:cobalamin biosynthesis protein CobD/CbiB